MQDKGIILNKKKRSTMLCVSGFELYSPRVPLKDGDAVYMYP